MTETMITRTALTQAAKKAGVTADQARTILEDAGVKVQPKKPDLPTEPGEVIIATEVRGMKGKWRMVRDDEGDWFSPVKIHGNHWLRPEFITAWTEAVVVPAGKKIDPKGDVREGDRVRLVLDSGDEVTFTVIRADMGWFESYYDAYPRRIIRSAYLLDQEDNA